MTLDADYRYFIRRARQESALADSAADPSARRAHLRLLTEYKRRARALAPGIDARADYSMTGAD